MARLYRYPVVDAGARGEGVRRSLSRIEEAAVDSDVPLVIFPEGHRSRDGDIGPFKKAGLRAVLAARPWTVYLVVVDGFWQRVTLKDLLGGATEIDGRVDVLGPYAWTDPSLDPSAFTESLRDRMLERLTELRAVQAA